MKITNRKARHEFYLYDSIEAGIQLAGPEVKSVKNGRIKLDGSFVRFINGEAYLVNADIPVYIASRPNNYDPNRTRKLLLHKRQLVALEIKTRQKKLTVVPVSCYTKHGLVKVEIALAKRKKNIDKREELRRKDLERETERALRRKDR